MFWSKPRVRFVTQHGVYAEAFQKLSRGLWLIFASWLAIGLGGILVAVVLIAKRQKFEIPGDAWISGAGGLLLIAGVIANLAGKYKCKDLHEPLELGWRLPGHRWLAGSLWCDIANFLLKWIARGLAMPWIRLMSIPLAIASLVLFLLFLRKTADIIDRPFLKRLADGLLGAFLLAIALGGGTIGLFALKIQHPVLVLSMLAVTLLLGTSAVCYLVLLMMMAVATGSFARHLADDEFAADESAEYEQSGIEHEPA